ncbi:Apolipoprotein(a) [Lamellibrachia satsuma]|nr:Apolipoprotein(a) [Lamellibrachia satsuma]
MTFIRQSHSVRTCQNERLINTMVPLDIRLPLLALCALLSVASLGQGVSALAHFYTSDVGDTKLSPGGRQMQSRDIDLSSPSEPKECLETLKGYDYKGHQNGTVSGRTCQAWASQAPHRHYCSPEGRSNYCTNIDSVRCRGVKPWCFTTDPEKRWEYCDLDHCEEAKECLETPKGYDYRGYKNQTVSGRTCQAWASKSPHVHACTQNGRSNYCTNIDSAACRGVKSCATQRILRSDGSTATLDH